MANSEISILVADNHLLIREGIRALLGSNQDFNIVAEAAEGSALPALVKQHKPRVVIMDYDLPGFFSIGDVRSIYEANATTNILVVTTNQNKQDILKTLEYGVSNYILKLCDRDEFISAIYATARGEKFFCGKVIDAILEKHFPKNEHCEPAVLSVREAEIVKLISTGLTNNEIAAKLYISVHTVSTHRKNILKKIGVNNSSELVLYAIKTGIISPNEN